MFKGNDRRREKVLEGGEMRGKGRRVFGEKKEECVRGGN